MTDPIFFDTDCLSAFFWVRQEHLLQILYPGRLVIPGETYTELSKVSHLKAQADGMISRGCLQLENILVASREFTIFSQLTTPQKGHVAIGDGEAACIALVITHNGTLASNNMRDVAQYVRQYNLAHITTASILKDAHGQNVITEQQGNDLWKSMLGKRRKLPNTTFSEYLASHLKP
nr:hypothetical protein [uncultured Sphaerochaeta sp.]